MPRLSSPDYDDYLYTHGIGFFSIDAEIAFERKLRYMAKYMTRVFDKTVQPENFLYNQPESVISSLIRDYKD